jgi:hypothetical protein
MAMALETWSHKAHTVICFSQGMMFHPHKIHCQLTEVYGSDVMMVTKWRLKFQDG